MSIRPEFLVRGADGRPLPPADLLEKIRQYDARIGLFYTSASWAITEAWTEDDPRRERIQNGEMQPEFAFDICGYLPVTCSLDEALPYIERELCNCSAEQFQALRYSVAHWNDGVDQAVEDTVMAGVSDALDTTNVVSPGIYTPVAINFPTPETPAKPKVSQALAMGARMAAKRAAKKAAG